MKVVGIDEVGRGCWAGPLVAGAVLLERPIAGLKDSKKLSPKMRRRWAAEIRVQAAAIGLGWVDAATIDKVGITAAVKLAMQMALEAIDVDYEQVIIDGHYNFLAENARALAVVKADDSVPAVSAASIVAKVARDEYMAQRASDFPGYGFDKHVGYGTALHLAGLKAQGICELHRRSFRPIEDMI